MLGREQEHGQSSPGYGICRTLVGTGFIRGSCRPLDRTRPDLPRLESLVLFSQRLTGAMRAETGRLESPEWHSGGRRFDPVQLHQFENHVRTRVPASRVFPRAPRFSPSGSRTLSAKIRGRALVDLMQGVLLRAKVGVPRKELLEDARSYVAVVLA